MIKKTLQLALQHKFMAGAIALAVVGGGYYGSKAIFNNDSAVRYAFAQVQKGTLITSISGSGQVSVSNQVDIKPKVSGDITYIGVKNGQEVKVGTLVVQIDARDAQKAVRDAEVNLENAKLTLDKLKLQQQQQLRGDTLNKTYEDGMKTLADFYGEFSAISGAVDDILFGDDLYDNPSYDDTHIAYYANYFLPYSHKNSPVPQSTKRLYSEIEKLHKQALIDFQTANRGSGDERRQAINSGYELAVKTAQLIKQGRDAVRPLYDYFVSSDSSTHTKWDIIESHYNDLSTYASTIDTYLQSLLVTQNTINSQSDTIENQPLDLRSQELTVKQRENALLDAQEKLADYYVRAPFDGVVAKVYVKKGDTISAGTVLATLVTKQKIAEISLNEVDVAQVKVDQKATLTFDAVPDLSLTGQVIEVDAIGTALLGVVTYTVKIGFDAQDERIKTAMSVSADIITEAKTDTLLIPNSAVKTQGNMRYVELPDDSDRNAALTNSGGAILKNPLRRQTITAGLSNDEFTEIISGLNEGDLVVTRTIQPNAQRTQTQSSQSGLRIPGLPTGGGGQLRR